MDEFINEVSSSFGNEKELIRDVMKEWYIAIENYRKATVPTKERIETEKYAYAAMKAEMARRAVSVDSTAWKIAEKALVLLRNVFLHY